MLYRSATCLLLFILTTVPSFAVDLSKPPSHDEALRPAGGKVVEETILSAKVGSVVTLKEATRKALENSPRLKSAASAREAAVGEKLQAGMLPNPEAFIEAENFAGGGDYKGVRSAEITYGVSQLLEVGGKRPARIRAGEAVSGLAELDIQMTQRDLVRDVAVAYAIALAAQEQVRLATEQKNLAAEVLEAVTKRVESAADPLYQKSKAEVAQSTSLIALDKAERELLMAKEKLALLWGGSDTGFDLEVNGFFELVEPEGMELLQEQLLQNPDFLRSDLKLERAKAKVDLEEANAIPDPSLSLGFRDFRESGDGALVGGISMPLPFFNDNSGNITKAKAELSKAESDELEARNQLAMELKRHWHELQNSFREATSLRDEILPSAEKSFELARHGYEIGKFPYLEVLDAQRTWFESREQYHQSLKQYHVSRAEVERLGGTNKENHEELNAKD